MRGLYFPLDDLRQRRAGNLAVEPAGLLVEALQCGEFLVAVELRLEPASGRQRRPVEPELVADIREFARGLARMRATAAADMDAEFASGRRYRCAAEMEPLAWLTEDYCLTQHGLSLWSVNGLRQVIDMAKAAPCTS